MSLDTADAAFEMAAGDSAPPRRRLSLPSAGRGDRVWATRAMFVAFALGLWLLPEIVSDPTRIRQWSEYLCYAMIAIGVDIAWGYGGMLALGQGVFFGLGAYCMGMYLKLQNLPAGSKLPNFMTLYGDYKSLPFIWRPFQNFWFTVFATILIPMIVAGALGLLVFKRRIRGPYFALLTQATALIFSLILVANLQLTAGTNGLSDFNEIFGHNKYQPDTNKWLYYVTAVGLAALLAVALKVVHSRYGKLLVATRDSEDRVRFLGYDPAVVKTIGFAIAAGMAGVAGALAAPVIGIVSPSQFAVLPSILMVCWVAVGGRGTLWGAILGAILVNFARTRVSEARPDDWQYIQGAIFVVVLAVAPGGILGLLATGRNKIRSLVGRSGPRSTTAISRPTIAEVTS